MINIAHSLISYFSGLTSENTQPLPQVLGQLCSRKMIMQMGREYLQKATLENDVTFLEELITYGQDSAMREIANGTLIGEKIKQDFDNHRIVVIRGWILSITEARQCALYYLS